jgi:Ran GTPase-activating protein (RanGAP) involved in mRNA processing and transport
MRSCQIDDKAMAALRPAISKLRMLERTDFSKNLFKEDGVHSLILAMRDANPSFLEITITHSSLHDNKTMKLVAAMLDKNARLTKLNLSNCNIVDIGIAFLMKVSRRRKSDRGLFFFKFPFFSFKGLVNHAGIRSLDLSGNKLGSSRASADVCIWASRNHNIEELRMARTEIPKKAAKAVSEMFTQQMSAMKSVDLSYNDFGPKGCSVILEGMSQSEKLQEVHLGGFDINEKSIEHLLRFIKRSSKTLTYLDLQATPIGKRGLNVVLEELGEHCHSKLTTLDLSRVQFTGKATASNLIDFLRKSTALERLIMNDVVFDKESWQGYCSGVQQSRSLSRLELDRTNVAKMQLVLLRDTLRQVSNVRSLSLRACNLDHEDVLTVLAALNVGTHSALSLLDVRGNKELVDLHKKQEVCQELRGGSDACVFGV